MNKVSFRKCRVSEKISRLKATFFFPPRNHENHSLLGFPLAKRRGNLKNVPYASSCGEPFKPKPAEPDPNDIKRKSNSSQGPLSSFRRIFDKRVLGRLRDQVSHPLLTFPSLLFPSHSLSFSLPNAFKDTSASSLPGIRRLLAINAPPFHASLCGRFSPAAALLSSLGLPYMLRHCF